MADLENTTEQLLSLNLNQLLTDGIVGLGT